MLSKEEIEKRLQGVAPELCVAFAVRSALRVLPLLAAEKDDEPFWYWPEQDRGRHFLAILKGLQVGRVMSVAWPDGLDVALKADTAADVVAAVAWVAVATTYSADFTAAAAAAAATAAVATAAAADVCAYNRVNDGYTDAGVANVVRAATAAYAYADAADSAAVATTYAVAAMAKVAYAAYDKALLDDLDVVTASLFSPISDELQREQITAAAELLQRPLWPAGEMPASIQAKWQLLCRWADSLGSGFEYWFDWYQDCLDGKLVDIDLLEKQFDIPAEIRTQGVKAINAYLASLVSPENKG